MNHSVSSVEECLEVFNSKTSGLDCEDANNRLLETGFNEIEEGKKKNVLIQFAEQFKSFLIIILLVAVAISAFLGELLDAIVIFAIVIAVAVLGFIQEFRAEKAIEALKQIAAPVARIIRDGITQEIPSREVVPGDIVLLEMGNKIPADVRLIEAVNLKIDEASLTGESVPVQKTIQPLEKEMPLADRKNMAYSGTTVAYGRGTGLVVATGMETEFGKIAKLIQTVEEGQTPLQQRLDHIGKWLGILCMVVVGFVASILVYQRTGFNFALLNQDLLIEIFIWSVSLAVAAVPEALPAVVIVALTVGVQRMARRHAIVRKLPVVETLGCTTVICSDKTGTLTKNEMTVSKIYTNSKIIEITGVGFNPQGEFLYEGAHIDPRNEATLSLLLQSSSLCTNSSFERSKSSQGKFSMFGDPTEIALIVAAAKADFWQEDLKKEYPRVWEIPFTSEKKFMATVHSNNSNGDLVAYLKGAPEIVLDMCSYVYEDGQNTALNEENRKNILYTNQNMASEALRVLAVAYKHLSQGEDISEEILQNGFSFIGLEGMIDPPREEVKQALQECNQAGIKTTMITGDHKLTAMAVAKEINLLKSNDLVLTGSELDELSDIEFANIVEDVSVYARVSPEHKQRIVRALQKGGHITAMTGDGINDAPALKMADIGVAMGIIGTDVSKEASDMILTDDNFATIVSAVEEGRGIFDNIKKYLAYLLSCNAGEILLLLVASLMGLPLPLIAIQLLWINLTTDGLPALALSIDPRDPDVLHRPPRDPLESVFTRRVLWLIASVAILITIGIIPVYAWSVNVRHVSIQKAQTIAFTMLVMFEMFNAFNCRSEKHSITKLGLFTNAWLLLAVASSIVLQLAVIYVPFLQPLFNTAPLTLAEWVIIIVVSSSVILVVEAGKFIWSPEQNLTI
ncbi:MAG: calcium-transporting P-type ATPase, PMR1-type [Candidatus Lokiarchaeota archaeon]|nr:calcium-transporting P-type ATPase, PMR1-type [Candidatus Lokiarchaeota archaeon]